MWFKSLIPICSCFITLLNFRFLIWVLFFFKILTTTYCDNDKKNNQIPGKEWVVSLVFIYTEPSCRGTEDSYGPCLIINTNHCIIKFNIFNIHQITLQNFKNWKSKWSNLLKKLCIAHLCDSYTTSTRRA